MLIHYTNGNDYSHNENGKLLFKLKKIVSILKLLCFNHLPTDLKAVDRKFVN